MDTQRKCGKTLLDSVTCVVFLFLDFLDAVLCLVFKLVDEFFEGEARNPCYCGNDGEKTLSESLYGRRKTGFLGFARKWKIYGKKKDDGSINGSLAVNRWSDCGCNSCVSWTKEGHTHKLHVVAKHFPQGRDEAAESVIFLHGFLSSSSFWTETVFSHLSESLKGHYRLFAVDLLGFGRSPKPNECKYTLLDHVEMIDKSVISPFQFNSFHLVAHSMGCIVALTLAAKYPNFVKSVTLVAPPYFPSAEDVTRTSLMVLNKLAGKTLWPPLAFGKSVMSWYEHVGRCFCFLFCRNHRTWEMILKLFTLRRELNFMEMDLTRHTHHSAWHNMHNTICGGATLTDEHLEILNKSKSVKVCIIHGDEDMEVPLECSKNMKMKFPELVELNIVQNADHKSVVLNRAKDFAKSLQHIWVS
ncbi:probable lysophospholipase BODYGUARD 4 isoform X1 [Hibiscus syriacus]|uniref:probable lysophospholipase BODYGUARD 4 isoform X1 n=1 Tax=Hibiscus syriacus TaxID=106335 RepID=UPI0019234E66|nr:probable lysophospholipase BODYGUARD 4 isoform X1 [Hibiscus syriacus]